MRERNPPPSKGNDGNGTGEELSLERAEELARELGIHPHAIRRVMERASRAAWYPGKRELVFRFPENPTKDGSV